MAAQVVVEDFVEDGPAHGGVDDAVEDGAVALAVWGGAEDAAAEGGAVEGSWGALGWCGGRARWLWL